MNPDFTTHEEATEELKKFKYLTGQEVIEKETGKSRKIANVSIEPNTWFDNGEEKTVGYDIRISFTGAMFFVRSKEFAKLYSTQ